MFELNNVYCGDSQVLMEQISENSVDLSFWSPPYFLGKDYEKDATYESWQTLLKNIITLHFRILKPGAFMVVNIADFLAFKDETMPKIMELNPANRKCAVIKEMILQAKSEHPNYSRYKLAELLHCSEQTIDRRLNGNNISSIQTTFDNSSLLIAQSPQCFNTVFLFLFSSKGIVTDCFLQILLHAMAVFIKTANCGTGQIITTDERQHVIL